MTPHHRHHILRMRERADQWAVHLAGGDGKLSILLRKLFLRMMAWSYAEGRRHGAG